jgi:hypothetical protein
MTWDWYLSGARISPGDVVEVLPDGKNGLPVVLDLSREPPGYRRGSHRCLRCHLDPYDPQCCRQKALPPDLRASWSYPS